MKRLTYMKLTGCGNDFIVLDNRSRALTTPALKRLATKLCTPGLSLGADGLIAIEPPRHRRTADFRWRLFNSDGSEAAFSGNGGRCGARFASLKRIAGRRMTFETAAGLAEAEVNKAQVRLTFPPPEDLRLHLKVSLNGQTREGHAVAAGVPHCVYFLEPSETLEKMDVVGLGRQTRHHPLFAPAGTNVNFLKVMGPRTLRQRTYERGVEDETLACGSGAVASALVAVALGRVRPPVTVWPRSNTPLIVSCRWDGRAFTGVAQSGEARVIAEGVLWPEAWEW